MASATFSTAGNVTGLKDGGSLSLSAPQVNISSPVLSRIDPLDLSSGDNTISVPSGVTAIWFTPPSANAVVLKLKGNAGDTGVNLHLTRPQLLHVDGSGQDIIINAASSVAGCCIQMA